MVINLTDNPFNGPKMTRYKTFMGHPSNWTASYDKRLIDSTDSIDEFVESPRGILYANYLRLALEIERKSVVSGSRCLLVLTKNPVAADGSLTDLAIRRLINHLPLKYHRVVLVNVSPIVTVDYASLLGPGDLPAPAYTSNLSEAQYYAYNHALWQSQPIRQLNDQVIDYYLKHLPALDVLIATDPFDSSDAMAALNREYQRIMTQLITPHVANAPDTTMRVIALNEATGTGIHPRNVHGNPKMAAESPEHWLLPQVSWREGRLVVAD